MGKILIIIIALVVIGAGVIYFTPSNPRSLSTVEGKKICQDDLFSMMTDMSGPRLEQQQQILAKKSGFHNFQEYSYACSEWNKKRRMEKSVSK